MKKPICISTGCFYRMVAGGYNVTKGMNQVIKMCSKLNIDGIELLFGNGADLLKFKPSKSSIKIFKNLKFNTIHAPFSYKDSKLYFMDCRLTKRILKKMYELYNLIGAKSINIHPQQIKNFKVFDKNYNYTIENMEMRHNFKIKDYRKILKNNEKFKFVLDTTHANEAGELKKLIINFKKDISYFHLSANYYNHLHLPFHILKNEHLKPFEIVKKLDVPVILENQTGTRTIKEYKAEVEFVRKWLN